MQRLQNAETPDRVQCLQGKIPRRERIHVPRLCFKADEKVLQGEQGTDQGALPGLVQEKSRKGEGAFPALPFAGQVWDLS